MSRAKLIIELATTVVGLATMAGLALPRTVAEVYDALQLVGLAVTVVLAAFAAAVVVACVRAQRQPPYH